MAEEVFEKIKAVEKKADDIIRNANEKAKNIFKDMEAKSKSDEEKIISDVYTETENLKIEMTAEADKAVKVLLEKEESHIDNILNISEKKMNEVVDLLAERIVK